MGVRGLEHFLWLLVMVSLVPISLCAYKPPDNYLIDCGSSSNTTIDGRTFVAENPSSWTLSAPDSIPANGSSSSTSLSSFDSAALYQTARIFPSLASYTFPIQQQGWHFIRLYFFPFPHPSYDLASATFTVSTPSFTLLNNFQVQKDPLSKEYLLNITSDTLVLSFMPSDKSVAFVSAIEVVSVPDSLVPTEAQMLDPKMLYQGMPGTALEKAYRVNMGGPKVFPSNDSLGRTWVSDQSFLVNKNLAKSVTFTGKINYVQGGATEDDAPRLVSGSATEMSTSNVPNPNFNVTWEFQVDSGYLYFIRLHFCDIVSTALNQLLFNVYIGSLAAAPNLDLSTSTGNTLAAPYYLDFIVGINDGSGKLRVSIGPTTLSSVDPNAILNGLEVMKMNNSQGSLSGQSSIAGISSSQSKSNIGVTIGVVSGAIAVIIIAVVVFFVLRRKKSIKKQQSKTWMPFSINGGTSHTFGSRSSNGTFTSITSGINTDLGFSFPFAVLQEATENFADSRVIGVGGFGKVYKGVFKDDTKVAVKRGNPKSQQGLHEFRTEIELLSRLRHRHLVSLIGYCDEGTEMILVYEFMEKGTLKSHLYGSEKPTLSWKQRLEICIGAARGLHYLHTGQVKAIIHRDVKSANILLDENLLAKVADFGLSKTGPELDQTHVSTAVKGSFGYLDPEYFRRQQLTEKSDVYSFGVLLFEVLCARPVIDPSLPREMVNLAEWAMKLQKRGQLEQIVDTRIAGTTSPESLRKFKETAEKCLADYGVDRPSMGDVLWNLEYALQLQEAWSCADHETDSSNQIPELAPQVQNFHGVELQSITVDKAGTSEPTDDDLTGVSMSKVFSQLVKAEGR